MEDYIDAPGAAYITGAGGKGGGGHTAQEAENTLRSSAIARIVEVISEGPIEGLAGGGQGIYINDTPFLNADGSGNFIRSEFDFRLGLPTQDYMPGFSSVETEVAVSTNVTIATNDIERSVSSSSIDAMMVTILLPNGLSAQDMSNGDINGSSVTFTLQRRLGTGTWESAGTYTISGKTMSPYEASYRVARPAGAGVWSVRVHRIDPDPAANVHNEIAWSRYTEIQEIKVSYPDAAVVGLAIDAQTIGNQIPLRSYLVKGLLIQIPSNYDPVAKTYSGAWDGTLVNSTIACDNPAWVLYDILTNTRYGAAIDPADIDKFSIYDAGVYCDEAVNYTDINANSATAPRFTFNARIADRPLVVDLVKNIAGMMNANLIYWNGKWTLIQDRPSSAIKLITKANVVGGQFTYKSSGLYERHTAVNVTYNDRGDRYLQSVVTVEDSDGINRYGYNSIDLAAFGSTTQNQAIRAARWLLDTELHQAELCDFKMSLNGFDLMPGDVVDVYDEDYANQVGAGRIVSYTPGSVTVTLDRAVHLTSGSTISALLADGKTLETKNITVTGDLSVITIDSAFSQGLFPQADFVITSDVSPRPFRIVNVHVPTPGEVEVQGVFYDANKWARIETGVALPSTQFSNAVRTVIKSPASLVLTVEGRIVDATGLPKRFVRVDWTPPTNTNNVAGYNVTWARNNRNIDSSQVLVPTCEIPADEDGDYSISVVSHDFVGNVSATPLTGTINVSSGALTVDPTGFGPPINFVAQDSNGTTWVNNDLLVHWADNPTNTRPAASYKLEVYTTGGTLLRSEDLSVHQYNYSLAMNNADGSGTPRTALTIKVYGKDALGAFSTPATVTFTNPAPAAITGFTVTGMYKAAALKWNPNTEADLQGYYVWRSTTSGFTPSAANLVYTGLSTAFLDGPLTDNTTYYWKIAGYDRFSKAQDGSNLNIVSGTAGSTGAPGINDYATAPTSGMAAGDLYYNTTDKNLYKYDGTNWRVVGAFSGTTTQMNAKTGMITGDLWSNTTDGKLYRYSGTAWVASVPSIDITGSLTDSQIAALSAAKLTGQITNTQITDGAISTPKLATGAVTAGTIAANTITAGQIAANTITAGQIAANTITASQIAANTITASQIAAGTISANELAGSSVTAGKIAANAISTSNIQAGAITAGSAILADASVSTLKIQGNAITVPSAAYWGSQAQITTTGIVPILDLWMNVDVDSPVVVTASAILRAATVLTVQGSGENLYYGYSTAQLEIAIYRDGNMIYYGHDFAAAGTPVPFSATIVDYPGVGQHHYQLSVRSAAAGPVTTYNWWGSGGNAQYQNPALVTFTAKR